MRRALALASAIIAAWSAGACYAADAPECGTFGWHMAHELALFAQPATSIAAGHDASSAARVDVDVLYAVGLRPRGEVAFAHAPGKAGGEDGGVGGILAFKPAAAGVYRVTLDAGSWVDVVNGGDLVVSNGFRGRQPCGPIHKSVAWSLAAGTDYRVQLSGPAAETVRLTITRAPADDL